MKKGILTKEQCKQAIESLGEKAPITIIVNRSRNTREEVEGIIESISPHFFKVSNNKKPYKPESCSYADMVCGSVTVVGLNLY